jgi:hypothetical protein
MSAAATKHGLSFAEAMASVETLPLEDQAALVDEVSKRIASARRKEIKQEINGAREEYRRGRVKRGSAATLMAELRAK